MKSFTTAAALALSTLTSFAQEATPAPEIDNFVSTRARAEVRAELQAALASGWRPSQGEASYAPEQQRGVSTRTRADVRAELLATIANGERLSYGEASPDSLPTRTPTKRGASTVSTGTSQIIQ